MRIHVMLVPPGAVIAAGGFESLQAELAAWCREEGIRPPNLGLARAFTETGLRLSELVFHFSVTTSAQANSTMAVITESKWARSELKQFAPCCPVSEVGIVFLSFEVRFGRPHTLLDGRLLELEDEDAPYHEIEILVTPHGDPEPDVLTA